MAVNTADTAVVVTTGDYPMLSRSVTHGEFLGILTDDKATGDGRGNGG